MGTCVVFMAYDLDSGMRYGKVSERRTKADYAAFVDELIKQHYPQRESIELVQDNLNTHQYGTLNHKPLNSVNASAFITHLNMVAGLTWWK